MPKKTYGSEMSNRERRKLYAEMTDLGEITRRYFVMNFFDGVLTVLGFIIGSFIRFLQNAPPSKIDIIVPAIATSIAIGISGISGGYLSERAERKRNIIEMHKSMAEHTLTPSDIDTNAQYKVEDYYPVNPIKNFEEKESKVPQTEHISVDPIALSHKSTNLKQKKEPTIAEKAERYASWIASLINGVSPAVGGLAVVIPFFFDNPNIITDDIWVYISSFILIVILLFFLGAYLAKISKDSIWKYGIKMIVVGVLTAGLAFLLAI